MLDQCIRAWQNALDCLPPEGKMTPQHKDMKAQFEVGLKKAGESNAEKLRVAEGNIKVMGKDEVRNDLPWIRALAMEKELAAKQHKYSSVRIYMLFLVDI